MVSHNRDRIAVRALAFVQLLCVLGAIWVVVDALTAATPISARAETPLKRAPESADRETLKTLTWYAPLWQRDLRQPPFPAEKAADTRDAQPPPELPTLLGTFIERDRRFGHFRTDAGRDRLLTVGLKLEGYEVVEIETGKAVLQNGEQRYRIEVPRSAGACTGSGGAGR